MTLDARGITLVRGRATVLRDVDVLALPGRLTGLIGPNGAGKTTLLSVLAGLLRPTHGVVTLHGREVQAMEPRQRARRIALLEQGTQPHGDMTVSEIVLLGRIPHASGLVYWTPDDRRVAEESMRLMEVEDLRDVPWSRLSGGQQQRVQIARMDAQRSDLLLLDEPTNHLDVRAQHAILRHVARSRSTGVMAIHDLNLAMAYCDRVVLLDSGTVMAAGEPGEVLSEATLSQVYGIEAVLSEDARLQSPIVSFTPADRRAGRPGGGEVPPRVRRTSGPRRGTP